MNGPGIISLKWMQPERMHLKDMRQRIGPKRGFVFFDTHDFIVHTDYDYSMAEFFVMHAYRHRGIGRYVATSLFERFGGAWEIGCHPNNLSSVRFWQKVVGDYTLGNCELMFSCPELKYHDGTLGNVISFHTDTQ